METKQELKGNETKYPGLDYRGPGSTVNMNMETSLHYGVIHANKVGEALWESQEFDYGKPHCPKCGNETDTREGFDYAAECGVLRCTECLKVWYPMEVEEGKCPDCDEPVEEGEFSPLGQHHAMDQACHSCAVWFDGEYAYADEPLGWSIDDGEYKMIDCLETDAMILDSPFYTMAQFCSPCVPGAGNLESPCMTGIPTHCLGHDWFEDDVAPYPVFKNPIRTDRVVMVWPDGKEEAFLSMPEAWEAWRSGLTKI